MMHKRISILSIEHPYEHVALTVLCGVCAVLVAGYLYFVGSSVLNIIASKEANAESARLQGTIANMEEEYFALRSGVNPVAATAMGLVSVSNTDFVYRPGNAAAVTIRPNEI